MAYAQADLALSVYVSGVGYDCTKEAVRAAFSSFGNITEVILKEGRNFAIIIFSDAAAVQSVLAAPPAQINGNDVNVEARNPKPKAAPVASQNIYMNNLPATATEEQVLEVLGQFGETEDVLVQAERGFAYATFTSLETAQDMVDASPVDFFGSQSVVEFRRSRGPSKRRSSRSARANNASAAPRGASVYVKGLDANGDESALRAAFGGFGTIINVEHQDDRDFAFIEYETSEQVNAAVSAGMNGGISVNGAEVVVEERKSSGKKRSRRRRRRAQTAEETAQ